MTGRDEDMYEVNRTVLAGVLVDLVASTRELTLSRSRLVQGAGKAELDRFCGVSETFIQALLAVAGLLYSSHTEESQGHAFRDALRTAALKRGSLPGLARTAPVGVR